MKIAPRNKKNGFNMFTIPPCISYEWVKSPSFKPGTHLEFKLRTNPADPESQTYSLKALIFQSGPVEQFLQWHKDLQAIIISHNAMTGAAKFALTMHLLEGGALAFWKNAAATYDGESDANHAACLLDLFRFVFPKQALKYQRCAMRRMRKPASDRFRDYVARFNQLNGYLAYFPKPEPAEDEDDPGNFPYEDQMFDEEEIKDILERGLPYKWSKLMVEQGFDSVNHTIQEFIEFCERLEFSEDAACANNSSNGNNGTSDKNLDGTSSKNRSNEDGKHGSKQDAKSAKTSKAGQKRKDHDEKWCPLHQTDQHDMKECKVIMSQVKKMHSNWDAQSSEQKLHKKGCFEKDGGDLHAMIQSMVAKELKQAVMTIRKHKSKEANLHAINESVNKFTDMDINDKTLQMLNNEHSNSNSDDK